MSRTPWFNPRAAFQAVPFAVRGYLPKPKEEVLIPRVVSPDLASNQSPALPSFPPINRDRSAAELPRRNHDLRGPEFNRSLFPSARGGNRTRTSVTSPPPQGGASTVSPLTHVARMVATGVEPHPDWETVATIPVCGRRDSNPRHLTWQASALTN